VFAAGNTIPLFSLNAAAIDTETTGLNPASARIVEIGAVRLAGGGANHDQTFRRLVRPGTPIPSTATAIHGIDDEAVARASDFPAIWREFSDFVAQSIVIGHMVGFDLAVLRYECERAGLVFNEMQALDTGLLARVVMPGLPDYSLENLSRILDVEITGRHSALGDAMAAAAVFRMLIPRLREKNVRTLGEAMLACRALAPALDRHRQAGWADVTEDMRAEAEHRRIDPFPYLYRVRDIMRAPLISAAANTSLADAVSVMVREKISSLYVRSPEADPTRPPVARTGIVTERDMLRALAQHGEAALAMPIETFASRPIAAIDSDAFVYRAIGRMDRLQIRHLAVRDGDGFVLGALSARDLLHLRAGEAVSLGDEIDQAADVHQLGLAWAKLPRVAASLLAEDISGRGIAAVISHELEALTRRAAMLAEARMRNEGHGAAPCPYAVAVLGSAARGESLLALDQDNAVVFEEGIPGGHEDRWFQILGEHLAQILHEVGVPYCNGGVMASNPQWRGSRKTWNDRIHGWIASSRPDALLSVDIFFDMLAVHGDGRLAEDVWRYGFDAAEGNVVFAKLLAEAAGTVEPGLNFFGGFRIRRERVDLKKSGLFGIVTAVRTLAICHSITERSTAARIAKLKLRHPKAANELEALGDAQDVFLDLILAQQIEDIARGLPATNTVSIKRLTHRDRDRLRDAFRSLRHLDDLVAGLLFDSRQCNTG
jgi:DNA polymerase-3 subunit epsilon/CBS domain-containing protein